MAFTKVEGLGNDFVLLDCMSHDLAGLEAELAWAREHAPGVCDRRRGVGADGILIVGPGSGEARASMIVVNFDGSRPEMCGNGLRCVAAFVAERVLGGAGSLVIDTDAGPKAAAVEVVEGEIEVTIDMGPGRMLGDRSPASAHGRRLVGVSMGNPHAICFVAADEQPEALARSLGPAIELDEVYAPDKTNVEFARVHERAGAPPSIELWVWERGVGITQACGTGACATAVAAASEGLVASATPIEVRLPGGRLWITVPEDPARGVIMRGPARRVFTGEFERASFESR
ncbi:MAG: diaminopimelate epimerase [Enhygromyxa sp.]